MGIVLQRGVHNYDIGVRAPVYNVKNNFTFYGRILTAILPTKYCKTYSILLKIQEVSKKFTGVMGISVELTAIFCK